MMRARFVRGLLLLALCAATLPVARASAQDGFVWHGSRYAARATVSFGIPETDASAVSITCPGPGEFLTIDFQFALPADFLADPTIRLVIDGETFQPVSNAVWSELNGVHAASLSVFGGAPLVTALMDGARLTVHPPRSRAEPFDISLIGSAAVMREFLAPCLSS